jgi:hypothetical protein
VITLPTGGRRCPPRRSRLLATIAVRNDARFLGGWLRNVAPQVDGVVALDDGSGDGGGDVLAAHSSVLEVLRVAPDRPTWDEVANHRALVRAALRHDAGWIVALDADERVEHTFRDRVERAIRRGRALGIEAFRVRIAELWDAPTTVRVDGHWGRKTAARLFRARADHVFDTRPLHSHKAPLQARRLGCFPIADLRVYHLRMVEEADRRARRERYESADPEARWQPGLGYAYLTDPSGLRLAPVPRRRRFDD